MIPVLLSGIAKRGSRLGGAVKKTGGRKMYPVQKDSPIMDCTLVGRHERKQKRFVDLVLQSRSATYELIQFPGSLSVPAAFRQAGRLPSAGEDDDK